MQPSFQLSQVDTRFFRWVGWSAPLSDAIGNIVLASLLLLLEQKPPIQLLGACAQPLGV